MLVQHWKGWIEDVADPECVQARLCTVVGEGDEWEAMIFRSSFSEDDRARLCVGAPFEWHIYEQPPRSVLALTPVAVVTAEQVAAVRQQSQAWKELLQLPDVEDVLRQAEGAVA